MNQNKFYGLGVALVTPFNDAGSIDFNSLREILIHVSEHANFLVVLGTTGEATTLTKQEKKEVLDFVKNNNSNNLPLIYGHGGNNTRELVAELSGLDLMGIDAILSSSPAYNKPSQEGIYQHYCELADSSPVPLILYNVPSRTASNISAETTLRLASHKNICGIKEASGNLNQAIKIAAKKPKEFLLISGDDLLTLPLLSIGAVGLISVMSNAYPSQYREMIDLFSMGNQKKAAEILYNLYPLNSLMYEEGNPVGVKQLLAKLNLCENNVRLPLLKASPDLRKRISENLID